MPGCGRCEKWNRFSFRSHSNPATRERKKQKSTLIDHYRDFILNKAESLREISKYVAVDGYFMK